MTGKSAHAARLGLSMPLSDPKLGLRGTGAPTGCLRTILSDPATAAVKA